MTPSSPELTIVEKKPFYHSWTLWLNVVVLVLTFIDPRFHDELVKLGLQEIWADRILLLANIGLRFVSSAQVTLGVFRRDP